MSLNSYLNYVYRRERRDLDNVVVQFGSRRQRDYYNEDGDQKEQEGQEEKEEEKEDEIDYEKHVTRTKRSRSRRNLRASPLVRSWIQAIFCIRGHTRTHTHTQLGRPHADEQNFVKAYRML